MIEMNTQRINKERLFLVKYYECIAHSVFFFFIVLNITYSTSHAYQTEKDLYFYIALIWCALWSLFVVKPTKIRSLLITIAIGSMIAIVLFWYKNISPSTYGPFYFKVLVNRAVVIILNVAIFAEIVLSKRLIPRLKTINIFGVLYICISVVTSIITKERSIPLVVPMVVFLMIDINKERWSKIVSGISVGYYLCFLFLFSKSLINSAEIYDGIRYVGDFLNIGAGGMFVGGAVICSLLFLKKAMLVVKNRIIHILFACASIVYPIYAVIKFESRGTEIGIVLAILCFFVFSFSKNYKGAFKRACFCICGVAVIFLLLVSCSIFVNQKYADGNWDGISYAEMRLIQLTNSDYQTNFFGDNFVLNAIDSFSSGRLQIWVQALPQVGLKPNYGYAGSPHSFFIDWLLKYGAPLGMLFLVWFTCYIIRCVRLWNEDSNLVFFTMLWHSYCFGACMLLTTHWDMILPFLLLILQYPLTTNWSEKLIDRSNLANNQ